MCEQRLQRLCSVKAVSLLMYCLKDFRHDTIADPNSLFGLAEIIAKTAVILEQNCQLIFVTGQASAAHKQHPCTLGTAASTQPLFLSV